LFSSHKTISALRTQLHNTSTYNYFNPETIHIIESVSRPFSTTTSKTLTTISEFTSDNINTIIQEAYHTSRFRFRENIYVRYNGKHWGLLYDTHEIDPFIIFLASLWGIDFHDPPIDIIHTDPPDITNPLPTNYLKCIQSPIEPYSAHFYTFISPHLLHLSNAKYFIDNTTQDIYALPIPNVSYITIPHNLSRLKYLPIHFHFLLHCPNIPLKDIIFHHL
jgi:hypothetical protein